MKICTKCGKQGIFYIDRQKKDGLGCWCKDCVKQSVKSHRAANLERIRAWDRSRRYAKYLKNTKKAHEQSRQWQKNNPVKYLKIRVRSRRKKLLKKYGLDTEKFESILKAQKSCCLICGLKLVKQMDQHIDHNHKTGKMRGILCRKCNIGIGHFNDNPVLLNLAMVYLRGFELGL